jgi:hypothetical protein
MKFLTTSKKKLLIIITCGASGVVAAFSVNNNFLHFSYRQTASFIFFLLLIPLLIYLAFIGLYNFAWRKRLKHFSIKSKWLLLLICITLGTLIVPPLTFKVPINLTISNSENGKDPSINNEIGVIEIRIEGGIVPFDWMKQSGDWEKKEWFGTEGLFSSGEKESMLEYVYETNLDEIEVEILFAESPSAGNAYVQIAQEFHSYKLQTLDDGNYLVTHSLFPPQLSTRWKTFLLLSYLSDILLVGLLLFVFSVWGLTSRAPRNIGYQIWKNILRIEHETINIGKIDDGSFLRNDGLPDTGRRYSARMYLSALLFITPPLIASLYLQNEVSFSRMLFTGGIESLLINLCFVVLFFYASLFIHALGTILIPAPLINNRTFFVSLDVDLIRFFFGASILTIFGFMLGLLNLLIPLVTIPIFCGVLFIYFLKSPGILKRFWNWITADNMKLSKGQGNGISLRHFVVGLNFIILIQIVYILLIRGVIPDLQSSDVMQLYFSYFAEVRLNHGTWIDPAHPIIYDFLIGRGMGVYLFFTSFTNQYFIQIIGVIYLVSIALVMHQFIFHIIPDDTQEHLWIGMRRILPACATITVLSYLWLITETGKYHLQTNAFLTFLSLYSLCFLFLDIKQSRWIFIILLPVVIAMPIAFLQSEIFVVFILMVVTALLFFKRGPLFSRYCVLLILASALSTTISLLFNQIYIGVAELNPSSLFLKFANLERLSQWTSIELINYISSAQNISLFSPRRVLTYFYGLIYPFVRYENLILIISFILLILGDVFRTGLRIRISRNKIFSNVFCFCLLFLLFAEIWIILTKLVTMPSLYRLFFYLEIYTPTFRFAVLIFGLVILQSLTTHQEIFPLKKNKWAILLSIMGIVLLICSLILEYPNSLLLHIILFLAASISILYSGWSTWIINHLQKISTYTGFIIPVLIAFITLYGAIVSFQTNKYLPNFTSVFRNFTGAAGLIESLPPNGLDFHRCLEILEAVPGNDPVLPLNANQSIVPCQNSPLLPRNKIVHHYQSVLSPIYKDVLFGDFQTMRANYRDLGINYFYLEKKNIQFFGPGYSECFNFENLISEFDVFWESDDFYIFTWRGEGIRPISFQDADYIEVLREKARNSESYYGDCWHGLLRLKEAIQK